MKFYKKGLVYTFITIATFMMVSGHALAEEVDSPNHKNGKHYTCIHFVNEYTGKEVRNSCTVEGVSTTKTYTHNKTEESKQGKVYKLVGWFDADGNSVSDASNPAKIKVSLVASSEKCDDFYYYLRWQELKSPVLHFSYIDNVSTGTGSWSNENGNTATYNHTFKKPEDQEHYKFLNWRINSTIYNENETFTYSFAGKDYNTEETITAYAWWQPSITLNLYDGNDLLKSTEDFEKVSIDNYKPTKNGHKFDGWTDEDGNLVTEDTFYADEASNEKVEPKVINLFARWIKKGSNNQEEKVVVKTTKKNSVPSVIVPPKTGI